MTVENCFERLSIYKQKMDDPNLSSAIRKQSELNYNNMKEHILKGKKFAGHPRLKELMPKEDKVEVKPNGKKSKR